MQHKKNLKNTFWAHQGNDYRPHFMRGRFLLGVFLLLFAAYFVVSYVFVPKQVVDSSDSLTANGLLEKTNQARLQDQKQSLQNSPELTRAAEQKIQDMIQGDYWAHISPSGTQPWFWLEQNKYMYIKAGENLARGYQNTDEVVQAWLNSKEHRDNMLNSHFTQAGFAVGYGAVGGSLGTVVVAFYGLPQTVQGGSVAAETAAFSSPVPLSASAYWGGASFVLMLALGITIVVLGVTVVAHIRHNRLPKHLRVAWHRHYVVYTAGLAFVVIIALVWFLKTGL